MREVNMEGIEVDSFVMKALRSLKDFKQGALVQNSLFSASYRTSPDLGQIATQVQIDDLIRMLSYLKCQSQ